MFSAVRKRFTYANVAMTLALVFAMTGGAYAAKKYLITSTKQISPKVLKQLKGKAGPRGETGAAGPVGAVGPAGKDGAQGLKGETGAEGKAGKDGITGTNGKDGTNGTNGVSVASSTEAPGANCKAGGSKFVAVSGTTYACNGENGQTGFTETLPPEKTETGAWSFSTSNEGPIITTVQFNIPLATALAESATHYVGPGETVTACPGTAKKPKANPGNLCVYQATAFNVQSNAGSETATVAIANPGATFEEVETSTAANGTGTTGAAMIFQAITEPLHIGYGTWAVTAPAGS